MLSRTLFFNFILLLSFSLQAQTSKSLVAKHLQNAVNTTKLTPEDLSDWIVTDEHVSSSSGVQHIYIRQRYKGIEVFSANGSVHILSNGELLRLNNQFVPNLAGKVNTLTPKLSAIEAVEAAARQLEYKITEPVEIVKRAQGEDQSMLLSKGGISLENIPAKLVFQPVDDALRLAWDISIYEIGAQNWWHLRIDATTGKILGRNNWVDHCSFGEHKACSHHVSNPRKHALEHPAFSPTSGPTYNVYPMPVESPNHGNRSLVMNPADATASPFGWHDTDGAAGAEFTITRGNNAFAYDDIDDDDQPGYSPDGGAMLNFDFPINLNNEPITYQDAAITNLFYWSNIMHDVLYYYGFDEASGNFQTNNYGNGGLGNDAVNAESMDGSGLNNANFGTPPDGNNPRMQMFLWNHLPDTEFEVTFPAGLAGEYIIRPANFGAQVYNLSGNLVEVNDGTANPTLGCNSFVNAGAVNGNIAFIDRGTCQFGEKALNAQNAGAIAVIICNNVPGIMTMSAGLVGDQVTIPVVMLTQDDCATIRTALPSPGVQVTLSAQAAPTDFLTSDLDNGVIAHEYVHGLTKRLTGGASNSSCLSGSEQMGEGWSDWYALMVTMDANDVAADPRGIATYLQGEPTTGNGLRSYPYSTDMGVNPFTYDDIKTEPVPHGVGAVWATMLWEMTWALIDRYGFDPDIYEGQGGNNIALRLVTEALKIQPCDLGFVEARDAILAADVALYNGAHRCLIWQAFAKRGLGYSAEQGVFNRISDGTEAFDLPPDITAPCSTTPDFLLLVEPTNVATCNNGVAEYEVTVLPANGYSSFVNLAVLDLPQGVLASFGNQSLNNLPASTTLTVFNLQNLPLGTTNIRIRAQKNPISHTQPASIYIINAFPPPPALESPMDAANLISANLQFEWESAPDAIGYEINIATNSSFSSGSIVHADIISETSYYAPPLSSGTYYWRVRTFTACGVGFFLAPRSFTIQSCEGIFTDSGGANGDYANNENIIYTICPANPGEKVTIDFTSFEVEDFPGGCYDALSVYDGQNTDAPLIDVYCGTQPFTVSANNAIGCLTIVFISDFAVTQTGWEATISCMPQAAPSISIADTSVDEGENGSTTASFMVSLSNMFASPVTVNYATVNGSATTQGGDYSAKQGTLTFQPGELSKPIDITVFGDMDEEGDETFYVNLSMASNATIADGQAIGTISNDDGCLQAIIENGLISSDKALHAGNTLISSSVISNNATVTYVAGQSITLTDGFHAQPGVTFTARIEPCAQAIAPLVESRSEEAPIIRSDNLRLEVQPNPFTDQTQLLYDLPEAGAVTIAVYNNVGQLVRLLHNSQQQAAGPHQLRFDRDNLPSGMYYIHLRYGEQFLVEKVVLTH